MANQLPSAEQRQAKLLDPEAETQRSGHSDVVMEVMPSAHSVTTTRNAVDGTLMCLYDCRSYEQRVNVFELNRTLLRYQAIYGDKHVGMRELDLKEAFRYGHLFPGVVAMAIVVQSEPLAATGFIPASEQASLPQINAA